MTPKRILRWVLTVFMVAAGINHFISPAAYAAMVPDALPAPLLLVQISGVAEILGGLGLILPKTRRLAAWGIITLLVAVFPANINMAVNHLPLGTTHVATWLLWARLPLQLVLIAWAAWFTRADAAACGLRLRRERPREAVDERVEPAFESAVVAEQAAHVLPLLAGVIVVQHGAQVRIRAAGEQLAQELEHDARRLVVVVVDELRYRRRAGRRAARRSSDVVVDDAERLGGDRRTRERRVGEQQRR